jgi:hypothetical protein
MMGRERMPQPRTAARRRLVAVLVLAASAIRVGTANADDETHLRFFLQNRNFLVQAFERLSVDDASPSARRAWDFDPFAAWEADQALQAVRAALDTADTPEHLGAFRQSLDSLLVAAQAAAARLDDLDRRFAAHLRTAVEVTLATNQSVRLERVEARLDGETTGETLLSVEERAALAAGGVLEVLRRVVEVRPLTLEVRWWLVGDAVPREKTEIIAPVADALLRIHLDLAGNEAKLVQTLPGGG